MSPLRTALFSLTVALAMAVLMFWFFRGDQLHGDAVRIVQQAGQSVRSQAMSAMQHAGQLATTGQAAGTAPGATGLHKCVSNGRVVYTDSPCEPGSAEHKVQGGSVTVVKAVKVEAPAAPAASGHTLGQTQDAELLEKRIDAATR